MLTAAAAQSSSRSWMSDVVDVRTTRVDRRPRPPGAPHPARAAPRRNPDAHLADQGPILFICARGVRSLQAAKLAERLGYTQVYNLDGGTAAWSKAGLPLVVDASRSRPEHLQVRACARGAAALHDMGAR